MSTIITVAKVNVITRSAARVAVKKLLSRQDVNSAKVIDLGANFIGADRWVVRFEYVETVIEQLQVIEHKTSTIEGTCEIVEESQTVENIGLPLLTQETKTVTMSLNRVNTGIKKGDHVVCMASGRNVGKRAVMVKIKKRKTLENNQ